MNDKRLESIASIAQIIRSVEQNELSTDKAVELIRALSNDTKTKETDKEVRDVELRRFAKEMTHRILYSDHYRSVDIHKIIEAAKILGFEEYWSYQGGVTVETVFDNLYQLILDGARYIQSEKDKNGSVTADTQITISTGMWKVGMYFDGDEESVNLEDVNIDVDLLLFSTFGMYKHENLEIID